MPCERVHYHAKVGGTSVLLWGGDFYNSFSFFLGQRFYRIGLCLYCFWHLNDSTLTSEKKKIHIKSSSPFLFVGSLAVLMALPPLLRMINLGLITRNYIVKNLLLYIWCMFRSFFFFFFFFVFFCFFFSLLYCWCCYFYLFFFLQLLLGSSFVHLFTNVVSILHFFSYF